MRAGERFEPGSQCLLLDSRGRHYLIVLRAGATFHYTRGMVSHDAIIGRESGVGVKSSGGDRLRALWPLYSDFVLKMKRGAQVVYPKDAATIIVQGDIFPGAVVLEAGAGSGALTTALLRAVGPEGRVITYETREDHAAIARSNVELFLGKAENLELKIADVYERIDETNLDRVVLDLPEPWLALDQVEAALAPGGVFVAYLPTTPQVQELTLTLRSRPLWISVETSETLVRKWHVEGRSVRPSHRMVGHTGFVTIARRVANETNSETEITGERT